MCTRACQNVCMHAQCTNGRVRVHMNGRVRVHMSGRVRVHMNGRVRVSEWAWVCLNVRALSVCVDKDYIVH